MASKQLAPISLSTHTAIIINRINIPQTTKIPVKQISFHYIFIRFLRWHYYVAFKEDPELPFLISIGLFSTPDSDRLPVNSGKTSESKAITTSKRIETTKTIKNGKLNKDEIENKDTKEDDNGKEEEQREEELTVLHPSVLKKRLEMFLKVFAAVISPKQLYLHQQLFDFYVSILARSETNIVRVAFDCILGYKPPYLMPVRENVRRLLDDKKIRDELVVFDPSMAGDSVQSSRSSAAVDEGQLGVSHISFLTSPLLFFPFALLLTNIYAVLDCHPSILAYVLPSFLHCSLRFVLLLYPLPFPSHLTSPHPILLVLHNVPLSPVCPSAVPACCSCSGHRPHTSQRTRTLNRTYRVRTLCLKGKGQSTSARTEPR
jgi:Down-regulated in metastasis